MEHSTDGDALARSQLALLYKLGVLIQHAGEQGQEQEEQQEENDPHAFLNCLPPPTTTLQSSGEHREVASWKRPFEPVFNVHTRRTDRAEAAMRIEHRVPLSPLSVAGTGASYNSQLAKRHGNGRNVADMDSKEIKTKWFRLWKCRMETKWTKAKAVAMGRRRIQRRMIHSWQRMVYQQRLTDARCRQLIHWKTRRALRSWNKYAALHGRVTWFLTSQGRRFALVNRLRRERIWRRWTRFVLSSRRQRKQQDTARTLYENRLLRSCWLEWRVELFQARHRRAIFRGFLDLVRIQRAHRSTRWELALELLDRQQTNRRRQLFRRWRRFHDARQRDHQRCWRVRMELSRGKYFSLWMATFQYARQIQSLSSRVAGRLQRDYLNAWSAAAKAVSMARSSSRWQPEAILSRCLYAWTRWARESSRFHQIRVVMQATQRRKAVRVMRLWALDHSRLSTLFHTADALARRRLLLHVWTSGWLLFHFKRQRENKLRGQIQSMAQRRVITQWRLLWSARQGWRTKKQTARKMGLQAAIRGVWAAWRRHTQRRRLHHQQLVQAARHRHRQLLMSGLVAFSKAADHKCASTAAARRVRVHQRSALKRRAFNGWKTRVQRALSLKRKIGQFRAQPSHTRTVWNPNWRWWSNWVEFCQLRWKLQRLHHDRRTVSKRQVFHRWKRRAFVQIQVQTYTRRVGQRRRLAVFSFWKSRLVEWRSRADWSQRAWAFRRRRHGAKALRCWRTFVRNRRGECQRIDQIRTRRQQHCLQTSFYHWRARFSLQSRVQGLESRRRASRLRCSWGLWVKRHLQLQKRTARLLDYHKLVGKHPSTCPLCGFWRRWKSFASRQRSVRQLQRKNEYRVAHACLSAWKTFRLAKLTLTRWHTVSILAGATHSDLGKRRRLFHHRCRLRRARLVFVAWVKAGPQARQRQHERLVVSRQRILGEILLAQADRVRYKRCSLRLWFTRWRRRQLAGVYHAACWFRTRLCHKVLYEWWRQVVHAKQERLLQDARKTVQKMSAHQLKITPPPTSQYSTRDQKKPPVAVRTSSRTHVRDQKAIRTTQSPHSASSSKRRMVDSEPPGNSYLQQSGRRLTTPKPKTQNETCSDRREFTPRGSSPQSNPPCSKPPSVQSSKRESPHGLPTPIQRRCPQSSSKVRELPLFDDEMAHENHGFEFIQTPIVAAAAAPPTLATDAIRDGRSGTADLFFSLEAIASMDPYSPTKEPRQPPRHPFASRSPPHNVASKLNAAVPNIPNHQANLYTHVRQSPPSEPKLFTTSQSLRPHGVHTQSIERRRPLKPLRTRRCSAGKQELSEILEIRRQDDRKASSTFRSVLHNMNTLANDLTDHLDADKLIQVIVGYYATRAEQIGAALTTSAWVETSGFCLLRDLGLFEDGHFLSAMARALQRLSATMQDPKLLLRGLLEGFIERHPAYKACAAKRSQSDAKPEPPLSWLVNHHLRRRIGPSLLSSATKQPVRPFWIRQELPLQVIRSLPKLLKCFHKYQTPLQQFYAWQPENAAMSKAGRMDRARFLQLMKHCNVYPQLFDRRELETACDDAGSRRAGASSDAPLNLPQFVETLVRCSTRLQWTDEQGQDAELAVVVQFLMLIFAMEGRGSMLTKRSKDLDVVLDFLHRQRHDKRSAKLRRFQGLLRAETSAKMAKPIVDRKRVFQMAMRGDPIDNKRTALDWDERCGVDGEIASTAMDARDQTNGARVAQPDHHVTRAGRDTLTTRSSNDDTADRGFQRHKNAASHYHDGFDQHDLGDDTSPRLARSQFQPQTQRSTPLPTTAVELPVLPRKASQREDRPSACQTTHSEHSNPTQPQSRVDVSAADADSLWGPSVPMERDAFLQEILSSIGDVEMLLQQADLHRPSGSALDRDDSSELGQIPLRSKLFSVAYPERYALLANGQLPLSTFHDAGEPSPPADDIRVGDRMLDYLTFADRFSESLDWQSHLSIADIAAHGIHAAFPSALHVVSRLETGVLDDLTDPQRTRSYLHAVIEEAEPPNGDGK